MQFVAVLLLLATPLGSQALNLTSSFPRRRLLASPACVLESGFEFLDNDIGNAPADQAAKCCELCHETPHCNAFTWTDFHGGTCWFKSGRGTVVASANAKSAVVQTAPGSGFCKLTQGIDYVGNDLVAVPSGQASGCCEICQNTPKCRAFSFAGGICWLKSAAGEMVVNPNVQSAEAYPQTTYPNKAFEKGIDYIGNDLRSSPGLRPEMCYDKCMKITGCRAFSWTDHNGGTCYLKNRKGATKTNPNVVSGTTDPNLPAPSCAMELDVDYVGNDLGNAKAPDAYLCCGICMSIPDCKAFSWTDHEGGTCFLKSTKGRAVAKVGVKSSVV